MLAGPFQVWLELFCVLQGALHIKAQSCRERENIRYPFRTFPPYPSLFLNTKLFLVIWTEVVTCGEKGNLTQRSPPQQNSDCIPATDHELELLQITRYCVYDPQTWDPQGCFKNKEK